MLRNKDKWGQFDLKRWNAFYAWAKEQGLVSNDLEDKGFTNELVGDWYFNPKDVSFSFGDKAVLNNVSLEVQKKEKLSLF